MAAAWSKDRVDQLVTAWRAGRTSGTIAEELGVSRNAVMGVLNRLRAARDPRVPPATRGAAVPADRPAASRVRLPASADRLAEEMARGCPSIEAAAYRQMMSPDRAHELWAKICARLGWQAV